MKAAIMLGKHEHTQKLFIRILAECPPLSPFMGRDYRGTCKVALRALVCFYGNTQGCRLDDFFYWRRWKRQ